MLLALLYIYFRNTSGELTENDLKFTLNALVQLLDKFNIGIEWNEVFNKSSYEDEIDYKSYIKNNAGNLQILNIGI